MGRFTDPHFLRRAKSRKSPKRPALPGAVIWVWAVHRPTPFNLLLFHTLFTGYIRGFFNLAHTGPNSAFWGLGRVPFPTLDAKPAHRAKRWPTGGFPVQAAAGHEKDCCLGFPGSGPVSLLWGLLEIFRFFLILRPEEVFLPQVIRLLLGDLPAPLAGIDGAVELVP